MEVRGIASLALKAKCPLDPAHSQIPMHPTQSAVIKKGREPGCPQSRPPCRPSGPPFLTGQACLLPMRPLSASTSLPHATPPTVYCGTAVTSSASSQSPHRAGPSPVAKHPPPTPTPAASGGPVADRDSQHRQSPLLAQQYDAAHETGRSSQAMWRMKALGPAGFAARNSSSRGGFSCLHTMAGGRSSILITAAAAPFSTSCPASKAATRYPPRPKPPPEHEFTEVYLKGTGPGGQKIVCPCGVYPYMSLVSHL